MPYKDNATRRAAYALRKDEFAAQARERRANDGGRSNELARRRRAADPEKRAAQVRAAYYADPEKAAATRRAYYWKNPERHREVAREAHARLMERDPEKYRAWVRARRAREMSAPGECSAEWWRVVLWVYGGKCLRCGSDDRVTPDHVVPLALGGSHWPWNHQPLCHGHNSSKGARSTADYRPDRGMVIQILVALVAQR